MIHLVLSLRWITLVAALGAAVGAVLMFGVGGAKLAHAFGFAPLTEKIGGLSVVALVMQATDAFLFGLVLVVFAYAITFGFAVDLPEGARARLPKWMRVDGIAEIKITLIEVILVYLVVDFVTDVVELATPVSWDMLVKPVAILLIAGALRLIETKRSGVHPDVPERAGKPAKVTRLLSGE
ncbi:YqhA family protein [Microvirga massiliensis]|uniref:YqhA family protein n=1 Tax=Microvirga massiliensis TaxID=1033741 RepID=UPI00062B682C|nr:YqhA family protein [Microvirga massiliensis]